MASENFGYPDFQTSPLVNCVPKTLINKKLNMTNPTYLDSNYCSCSRYNSIATEINPVEQPYMHNEVFLSTNECVVPLSSSYRENPFFSRAEIESKFISRSNKKPEKYKTEMCRNFEWRGECNYGDKCQYAHGCDELMPIEKHPKYKTKLCAYYHTKGICDYGRRCNFIHDEKIKKLVSNQIILDSKAPCNELRRLSTKSSEPPKLDFPDLENMISNFNKLCLPN